MPADPWGDLTKSRLHEMADALLRREPAATVRCVAFFAADSVGFWHNRARALIARRLKHIALDQAQRDLLVASVIARLLAGRIPEQFRDQLRLALHLAPASTRDAARRAQTDPRAFVRRFAAWVLTRGKK